MSSTALAIPGGIDKRDWDKLSNAGKRTLMDNESEHNGLVVKAEQLERDASNYKDTIEDKKEIIHHQAARLREHAAKAEEDREQKRKRMELQGINLEVNDIVTDDGAQRYKIHSFTTNMFPVDANGDKIPGGKMKHVNGTKLRKL
jgi:hypothetical protein